MNMIREVRLRFSLRIYLIYFTNICSAGPYCGIDIFIGTHYILIVCNNGSSWLVEEQAQRHLVSKTCQSHPCGLFKKKLFLILIWYLSQAEYDYHFSKALLDTMVLTCDIENPSMKYYSVLMIISMQLFSNSDIIRV